MRIEMQGQGSESFYKEVVSIAAQHKSLLNRPTAPLPDIFTQLKRYIAICAVLTVFLGIITVMYGADTIGIIALVLNAALIVFCVYRLISLNRFLNEVKSDQRKTALVLDLGGAAVEKDGAESIRINWKDVAFVRKFKESIGIIASGEKGIITVNRRYEKEIMEFLRENVPEVRRLA